MSIFSPEINTVLMFGLLLIGIFLGYQIAFLLAGIGLFFGLSLFGMDFVGSFTLNFLSVMKNYILLAIPLFVLMGNIMERSGASEKLFGAIYILSGRLRGRIGRGNHDPCHNFCRLYGGCWGICRDHGSSILSGHAQTGV